jgi:hypothetical protein
MCSEDLLREMIKMGKPTNSQKAFYLPSLEHETNQIARL